MSSTKQFCTFYLAGQCYGLDVLKVQEIVRSQPMTCVPLAHHKVRGLINLRGQIVTAIDLRRCLDLPERDDTNEHLNVVVLTDEGPVSLLVDEIGDVLELSDEQFERPPETLQSAARDLIVGAYKLPERLVVILDSEQILVVPQPTGSRK